MRILVPALAAALAVASAGAAVAKGSCGYERCFGAIAIGKSNVMSRVTGHRTIPGATDAAKLLCGESCDTVEVFWNACGAVALSRDGQWSFGWDETLENAMSRAVAICKADDGAGCYVREWACSK
jgi:hypothetical protein